MRRSVCVGGGWVPHEEEAPMRTSASAQEIHSAMPMMGVGRRLVPKGAGMRKQVYLLPMYSKVPRVWQAPHASWIFAGDGPCTSPCTPYPVARKLPSAPWAFARWQEKRIPASCARSEHTRQAGALRQDRRTSGRGAYANEPPLGVLANGPGYRLQNRVACPSVH